MGIADVITAARSPWQNPYVERVIGTIPRELHAPSSCGASSFVILVHCFDGESRASSERGPCRLPKSWTTTRRRASQEGNVPRNRFVGRAACVAQTPH